MNLRSLVFRFYLGTLLELPFVRIFILPFAAWKTNAKSVKRSEERTDQ